MRYSPKSAARQSVLRAFTLIEILIVLAIIGMLAGLAINRLGNSYEGAQVTAARIFVSTSIKTPLNTYRIHMGNYPTTSEGLQALITPPSGGKADRWMGPYIEGTKIPTDPWGEPYQYAYPGTHNKDGYDIWSKGPPGKNTEIGNWDTSADGK